MAVEVNSFLVRLGEPNAEVLAELKGRLQLQFRDDPAVRQDKENRIADEPDDKSQSGAEAFLIVYFASSAAVAATHLVVNEFRARGIACGIETHREASNIERDKDAQVGSMTGSADD